MAFVGVEFVEDDSLAIVNSKWLTPRKKQVFWPPFKQQKQFDKAVKRGYEPDDETWEILDITKCYFSTDDFKDAEAKLKIAECYSDVPDVINEQDNISKTRKRLAPKRYSPASLQEGCDVNDDEPLVNARSKTAPQPSNICESQKRRSPVRSKCDTEEDESPSPVHERKKVVSRPPRINCNSFIPESSTAQFRQPYHQSRGEASSGSIVDGPLPFPQNNTLDRPTSTPRSSLNQCLTTQIPQNLNEIDDEDLTGKPAGQQIATYLSRIYIQNRQILNMLTSIKKQNQMSTSSAVLPENLPVTFPLEQDDDLKLLEIHLKEKDNLTALSLYLSTLGGRGVANQTNTILKFLMSDNLATKFSFKGTRNDKKPFINLGLKTVIVRAVRGASAEVTERAVEDLIKVWLKHAPERLAKKKK